MTLIQNYKHMNITLKDSYKCTCAHCNEELTVIPSLIMQSGTNRMLGKCYACGTMIVVSIYPDLNGDIMISKEWEEVLHDAQTKR